MQRVEEENGMGLGIHCWPRESPRGSLVLVGPLVEGCDLYKHHQVATVDDIDVGIPRHSQTI